MKDLIKEVALEVAEKFGVVADDSEIVDLVTWCVAELSKRAEAVAYDVRDSNGDGQTVLAKYVKDPNRLIAVTVTKLFTFPPTYDIEAIDNRVAETYEQGKQDAVSQFVYAFKRHVGGDGEFWVHELEDFAAASKQEK